MHCIEMIFQKPVEKHVSETKKNVSPNRRIGSSRLDPFRVHFFVVGR